MTGLPIITFGLISIRSVIVIWPPYGRAKSKSKKAKVSALATLLCIYNDRTNDPTNLLRLLTKCFRLSVCTDPSGFQQPQPVDSFAGFFQCNTILADEVCPALSSLSFFY